MTATAITITVPEPEVPAGFNVEFYVGRDSIATSSFARAVGFWLYGGTSKSLTAHFYRWLDDQHQESATITFTFPGLDVSRGKWTEPKFVIDEYDA